MYSNAASRAKSIDKPIRIRIKKGSNLQPDVAPFTAVSDTKLSRSTAILGRDYPGTRFEVLAEQGAEVKAGDPVLRDRRRPEILFTSPLCGTVSVVHRGARRALECLAIMGNDLDSAVEFDIPTVPALDDVRQLMLQSGLWTALRSRPYGRIPDPDGEPGALLVTAIDTRPLAPDPGVIISEYSTEFSLGMNTVGKLINAPTYLCKSPHGNFDSGSARVAEFQGPHPAGLPGVHIHELCPVGFDDGEVWTIGYQDVISLGHLIMTGKPWHERIVSLAGDSVRNPRLIRVTLGSGIDGIIANELVEAPARVISGSLLSGHNSVGNEAYLGRLHYQVTAFPGAGPDEVRSDSDAEYRGEPGPLIPVTRLNDVAPPGILAVPLLRALLVGDFDRARDLGALELVEEDLALLSYVCPSGTDYGVLLRGILDQLYKEGLSKSA